VASQNGTYHFDYLVIGGGEIPRMGFLKKLASFCSNVVTVDRGAFAALRMGAAPVLHVGDDDSFFGAKKRLLRAKKTIKLDPKKSVSDLEYALQLLPKNSKIIVVAAHRDHEHRTDHVFINLLAAIKYTNITLVDEEMWIQKLKTPKIILDLKAKTVFSIVPLSPLRITIDGARYPLKNKIFKNPSVGLSNESLGRPMTIKARGPALIFVVENILSSALL
jgi:thiamine pyrophosphokinase